MTGVACMAKDKRKSKLMATFAGTGCTEAALLQSMMQSKTLTAMVVVLVLLFSGFCYFLFA